MCSRYNLITDGPSITQHFEAQNAFDFSPRFNIAPSQVVPVVTLGEQERKFKMMKPIMIIGATTPLRIPFLVSVSESMSPTSRSISCMLAVH